MKKRKNYLFCIFLCLLLCLSLSGMTAAAVGTSEADEKTADNSKTAKKKKYRNTFRTLKGKTYYYNSKGKKVTGWHKINGNKYYFDQHGVMQKSYWIGNKYVNKDGVYTPSKNKSMTKLKKKLKSSIKSYRGTWSVYVKNLDTGESFSINNQKIYAASLIKLYAMGAVYEKIHQGKIRESSVKNSVRSMITVSSNDAFNTIVQKVGKSYINKWCKKNGYTKTNQGHGLSPSGNNYGLSNGSGRNMTSVADCGKFLESVYNGTCVSKSASKKMLSFLKSQKRRWKIPAGIPKGVTVANKTGETNSTTHDAAIVYSKGADYIICVMSSVPGGGWSSARHITSLSRQVYNYFN